MKIQTALEYLFTYSWTFIVLAVVIAVLIGVAITQTGSTASASFCYIQPAFPCYLASLRNNIYKGSGGSNFSLVLSNNLGINIEFPPNSITVYPAFSSLNFTGKCTPIIAVPGATITCMAFLNNFQPNTGAQTNPKFKISYGICIKYQKCLNYTTVYMGFASTNTNLFSGVNVGEAPQLSSTYAQYDNGANIFSLLYQNFAGTSLPAGWAELTGGGQGTYTFSNSATVPGGGCDGVVYYNTKVSASNVILDSYVIGYSNGFMSFFTPGTPTNAGCSASDWYAFASGEVGVGQGASTCVELYSTTGTSASASCVAIAPSKFITSLNWTSSNTFQGSFNYGGWSTLSTNIPGKASSYPGIAELGIFTDYVKAQWIRLRAYPPRGVMPLSAFGSNVISASLGNIIAPRPILNYVPINISNTQPVATASPFQEFLQVNSGNYMSYETGNLMNVEFFFANGTIIPSWLESGNSNTLSNTIYWLNIPGLAASNGNIPIIYNTSGSATLYVTT